MTHADRTGGVSAFELLRQITPEDELLQLAPTAPAAVYTTLVTSWMLTLQRLTGGMSLSAAVKEVLEHSQSLLPKRRYERALAQAAKNKLPNRPGRSYPRRAHPRRQKSTKLMQTKPPPTTK
jgi:hypothetical protein